MFFRFACYYLLLCSGWQRQDETRISDAFRSGFGYWRRREISSHIRKLLILYLHNLLFVNLYFSSSNTYISCFICFLKVINLKAKIQKKLKRYISGGLMLLKCQRRQRNRLLALMKTVEWPCALFHHYLNIEFFNINVFKCLYLVLLGL